MSSTSFGKISDTQTESLRGFPGSPQVLSRGGRCADSLRPVHPRSRHQTTDAGQPRDSPRAEGIRAAGDARRASPESTFEGGAAGTSLAWHIRRRANLSNLVAEIREALGDQARTPLFVRTAHGFGYAFCGDTTTVTDAREPAPGQVLCWLEWNRRRFPLSRGEHVIGRDPDVEIRLDESTVSRRHARIVVTPEGSVLEDVDSKNGTFRGTERVTSPVQLADGDAIRIGSLLVIFHMRAPSGVTETLLSPAP